jgi:protein-tyrosine phosphatase
MSNSDCTSILFVCMGNICRSPTAEGVFRKLLEDAEGEFNITIDSAGTHAYHVGQSPDERAVSAALRRGIDISGQRARAVALEDFADFDLILAMDEDNLAILQKLRPAATRAQLELMLSFNLNVSSLSVPDPYYGGAAGFERVLDMLEEAGLGLLEQLRQR